MPPPKPASPRKSASASAERSVVIVESPAKAKTINKFLGRGYIVKACMGHVRDLPPRRFGIDVDNNFAPDYRPIKTKTKVLAELKAAVSGAKAVYLAPDPDREGEAIAWHLKEALKLKDDRAFRVTFNEITKKAVQEAFKHPTQISMERVNAQQARRFLDRIVGYKLSPLLWKKIARGLSAGRVQSVAVKLIVDREKEIEAFTAEEYWTIAARLTPQGHRPVHRTPPPEGAHHEDTDVLHAGEPGVFTAALQKVDGQEAALPNQAAADAILARLKGQPFRVRAVVKKDKLETPPSPFTTSLLQQQASTRLHFSTRKTMMIAQQLYEGIDLGEEGSVGLITYMRTDSFRISEEALGECRAAIPKEFGPKYLSEEPRVFKARSTAQEAHEAIRPTSVLRKPDDIKDYLTQDQYRLYRLIWKRFVATQMAPAVYAVTEAILEADGGEFQARGREMRFDGFTRLTGHALRKDEQILPALTEGQELDLVALEPTQHFTQPPPRFGEASLVKTLEKHGIGRPSTYAPIISTIQDRGYVENRDRRLSPTPLGRLVTDKLETHFADVMDTQFTSQMEEDLDRIEDAKAEWTDVLRKFYTTFMKDLEKAVTDMPSEKGQLPASGQMCEKCGKPMVIRWTKSGSFLGCSGYPECKNAKTTGEQVEIQENCDKCGKPLAVRSGRFGRFIACTGYPDCKNARPFDYFKGADGTYKRLEIPCEACGKPMRVRRGRGKKPFLACSGYPECKSTKPMPRSDAPPGGEGSPPASAAPAPPDDQPGDEEDEGNGGG